MVKPKPLELDSSNLTLGDYFTFLAGKHWRSDVLTWPPDVFCLMAALLQKTGAYIRLVSEWPPGTDVDAPDREKQLYRWIRRTRILGQRWWYYASKASTESAVLRPAQLAVLWDTVLSQSGTDLDKLERKQNLVSLRPFWAAVLQICAAADEACVGMGLSEQSVHGRKFKKRLPPEDMLWTAARRLNLQERNKQPSTLTRYIVASLAAVLPKRHTPQSGITLRSISHHLAFLRTSEVRPQFYQTAFSVGSAKALQTPSAHALRILLVPWPMRVDPSEFEAIKSKKQTVAGGYGFFRYNPKIQSMSLTQRERLKALLARAEEITGPVDGVIFPELALTEKAKASAYRVVQSGTRSRFMIAGVGSAGPKGDFGSNRAVFMANVGKVKDEIVQDKHHRWQLDRNQLEQYGLGAQLDPTKKWWEHISIQSRRLAFVSVRPRITLSVLICEDLARQDPVSDILRAIGPNLIVALLMDGPQLSSRWPAHYASVFADDPGSSVLTFTSLGMTQLCRPPDKAASRVVGLWKDKFQTFRQIELEPGSEGIVLSLTMENRTEVTADGRKGWAGSTYLRLNGIHQVGGLDNLL